MSGSTDPGSPPPTTHPSKGPIATAFLMIALLAVFVWAIQPTRTDFRPAPLDQLPEECLKVQRAFVPSNVTEMVDPPMNTLAPEERLDAIYRMNFEPCPCGCNHSIAECRATNPQCKTCRSLAERVIAEVGVKSSPPSKRPK